MITETAQPITTIIPRTEFAVTPRAELERPYRVIIENDDITPMEFVVLVLLTIFALEMERANAVMFEAHEKGRAYVVTLPFEEAQERVTEAQTLARANKYPLSFYLEPED